jgi:hypothetical protein
VSLQDDLAAMKARERADLEKQLGSDDPDVDFEKSLARQCPWCRYVYSTTKGINARRTIWIEQAQHFGHLRCWQAYRESQR